MLYTLSEFMTSVKEDIGIADIALPVSDTDLVKRFEQSALREFSVRSPRLEEVWISDRDAIDLTDRSRFGYITYIIPRPYYEGTKILTILGINPGGYGAGSNMYMPNVVLGSADMLLESIGDIKMAASLGSMMCHSPTIRFEAPNKLIIYNGWTAGSYRVELGLLHDISLSTIPAGAFTNLRRLTTLDLKAFLYNKMKRKTTMDVGVGTIDLKIDNWESAAQEMQDLLDNWDESGSIDLDRINYY